MGMGMDVHVLSNAPRNEILSRNWLQAFWGVDDIPSLHFIYDRANWFEAGMLGEARIAWDWYRCGSRMIREMHPNVVVLNGIVPVSWPGSKIAVFHHADRNTGRMATFLGKRLYRSIDRTVGISEFSRRSAERMGIACDKTIPLPLKIDEASLRPWRDRKNLIVHVGTADRKNPEVSIAAVAKLRGQGVDAGLVLVGTNHRATTRIVRRHQKEIGEWLTIREEMTNIELRELYESARLVLAPSEVEGFSYAVLEAAAAGTPSVVSYGVPEEAVLDGVTGVRMKSFDPGIMPLASPNCSRMKRRGRD